MGSGLVLASAIGGQLHAAESQSIFTTMGVGAPFEKSGMLKDAGAGFLTQGVGDFLVPDQSDEKFAANLEALKTSKLPVLACNGFIRPKNLRAVGADVNHEGILEWSEVAFRRLAQVGGKFIVFGSSSARELRDGWPKEKANEQFITLLKKLGPLAEAHGVTVILEQLRKEECNFINHLSEAAALIRSAEHPNIRLLADLYHMACVGDTPDDLAAAADVLVYMEIAEKAERTAPGVKGDDFRPYFKALKKIGYKGPINIEGRWQDKQIQTAFQEIKRQAAEA